jgi:hypothetical protein
MVSEGEALTSKLGSNSVIAIGGFLGMNIVQTRSVVDKNGGDEMDGICS